MPQLIPFYFINQVTYIFLVFIILVYISSKYMLPMLLRLFLSRKYITKL